LRRETREVGRRWEGREDRERAKDEKRVLAIRLLGKMQPRQGKDAGRGGVGGENEKRRRWWWW
jgi:hypothetical protein